MSAAMDLSNPEGRIFERFEEILNEHPTAIIAVDIPIGLMDVGSRTCDQRAREYLKPHRSASVFSAPLRDMLTARSHAEASAMRRKLEGKGMSIQAFAITAKIREVDSVLQRRVEPVNVYEVHPEVSFARLNGGAPIEYSKKTAAGRQFRSTLLEQAFPGTLSRPLNAGNRSRAASDDVIDSLAALWSASRIASGSAVVFDGEPSHDRIGRRMSISS